MKYKTYDRKLRHIISTPFIWLMIIPIFILDIALFLYQQTCFRLYKIKRVKRRNYIILDRHKLKYLTFVQKLNCMYCGYANGLFAYSVEIGARTEAYWCSIKHKENTKEYNPKHHEEFLEYGDEKSYNKKYS
ncbi:MAG: hypothetical protein ACMXX9_02615 [Candidatus Woesearchaeota archaeon]